MQQSDGLEFKRIVSPPKCFFLGLDKRKDENSSGSDGVYWYTNTCRYVPKKPYDG